MPDAPNARPLDAATLGSFIARVRAERGLTQRQLAERLYVSDKTVSKWERGLSLPSVPLLVPLADALGLSISELM
ncbi:helix-turn-helix transcriptional regulator, partial [Olsenella uli]|uniref:helix-turn-helix domain-containing protein n=1 Tax=Olsenella uli TaxID=133926 RepID=UPI00195B3EA9